MGEEVNRWMKERTLRQLVLPALPVLLLLGGCASSPPPPAASVASPPPAERALAPAPAAEEAEPSAAVIASVEVREGAPEATIEVAADRPLVWTSYRDAEGRLVIELPNSVPGPEVPAQVAGAGLVTGVSVVGENPAGYPLTRLLVGTSEAVEHSMGGEGSELTILLMPAAPSGTVFSYEPLPATAEVEPGAQAPAAAPVAPVPQPGAFGTPDSPMVAPPPTGVVATRLQGVVVLSTGRGTALRIVGDGEFSYSTFALDDPFRFVIDLAGVINDSRRQAVAVDAADVERVRIAQFKPYPQPVSRVVFDLREAAVPQIERSSDGLIVRFGPSVSADDALAAGGTGAENGIPVEAQGGSEAAPSTTAGYGIEPAASFAAPEPAPAAQEQPPAAEEEPAAEAETEPPAEEEPAYELTYEPVEESTAGLEAPGETAPQAVEEPEPEPAPPVEAPIRREVETRIEETPPSRPVEAPPPATAPAATSDVEQFGRAAVEIKGPAPADGSQSFTAQRVGGERKYFGEPITMSLRDADLVETLRSFALLSGLNIVIQPGVRGSVTVQLEDVPWDQAFEQILKINGLGYELEGNIMRIAPVSTLREEAQERQRLEQARALSVPLQTVIKRLSYSNAGQIASLLSGRGGVLSQRGNVIVDQRTNTLIIKELPTHMDTVIAVIETLDIPEPQVMIEARIVETRKNFTRTLGIDWTVQGASSAALGNTTGLVFPATVDGSGGVNLITGGSNAFLNLSLGTLSGSFQIDAALQAAENEGLINVLSAPKVATLNNERATIQSGFQIPIQTVANNTVTVQFVNATLRLDVTPQVTAEGTILMEINIQKRNPEFALQVQGASAAPISTKEARTKVIVRDGGTTVIGGIYEVSTNEGEDRVPGLANVPIIGHLFKNRRREDSNNELLIFITPRVIRI